MDILDAHNTMMKLIENNMVFNLTPSRQFALINDIESLIDNKDEQKMFYKYWEKIIWNKTVKENEKTK